jgi:transcriptional regulator, arsR family
VHSDDHPRREDIRLVAVLRALADPVRLSVVRQVADDRPHACGSIATPLAPSAMTRHFRILRESGLVRTDPKGTSKLLTLRRDDLDARFPGLLDAVLRTPDGDGPAPGARSE